MIPVIFYFVIIFLVIIYGYIYIDITKESIEKKHQERMRQLAQKKKDCFLKDCDETYYFSKSRDQN